MRLKPKISIADHFGEMEDPRVERSIQHKLIDIITIAIAILNDLWEVAIGKKLWKVKYLVMNDKLK